MASRSMGSYVLLKRRCEPFVLAFFRLFFHKRNLPLQTHVFPKFARFDEPEDALSAAFQLLNDPDGSLRVGVELQSVHDHFFFRLAGVMQLQHELFNQAVTLVESLAVFFREVPGNWHLQTTGS